MRSTALICILVSATWIFGCSAPEEKLQPGRPAPVEPFDDDNTGVSQAAGKPATPQATATPKNADGPHISRSKGKAGGLVVFWPRVIPRTDDKKMSEMAKQVQALLVKVAKTQYKTAQIDVRPEPERVCPRAGCTASTAGALLTHGGGGCTVIALVAKPGKSPTRLVPWAGVVELKQEEVPFREYPESQVVIQDAVPCDKLLDALAKREKEIAGAL